MTSTAYNRRQVLWGLWVVLPATAALTLVLAWPANGGAERAALAALVLGQLAVLAGMSHFELSVDAEAVRWRYGLFGWPNWTLPLADIRQVEPARSSWIEGWGIRRTKEGMLYNARGPGTVRLTLKDGRRLRLGSDEPERLAAIIAARL